MAEKILAIETIQIERKKFELSVRENDRGRILQITEEAAGKRNTVIVPWTGFEDFDDALARLTRTLTSLNS